MKMTCYNGGRERGKLKIIISNISLYQIIKYRYASKMSSIKFLKA